MVMVGGMGEGGSKGRAEKRAERSKASRVMESENKGGKKSKKGLRNEGRRGKSKRAVDRSNLCYHAIAVGKVKEEQGRGRGWGNEWGSLLL